MSTNISVEISLRRLCISALVRNREHLGDLGDIDPSAIRDLTQYCSIEELARIEDDTRSGWSQRDLCWYTWHVWYKHYVSKLGQPSFTEGEEQKSVDVIPLPGDPPEDYIPPPAAFVVPQGHWRLMLESALRDQEQMAAAKLGRIKERLKGMYSAEKQLKESRMIEQVEQKTLMRKRRRSSNNNAGSCRSNHQQSNQSAGLPGSKKSKMMKTIGLLKSALSSPPAVAASRGNSCRVHLTSASGGIRTAMTQSSVASTREQAVVPVALNNKDKPANSSSVSGGMKRLLSTQGLPLAGIGKQSAAAASTKLQQSALGLPKRAVPPATEGAAGSHFMRQTATTEGSSAPSPIVSSVKGHLAAAGKMAAKSFSTALATAPGPVARPPSSATAACSSAVAVCTIGTTGNAASTSQNGCYAGRVKEAPVGFRMRKPVSAGSPACSHGTCIESVNVRPSGPVIAATKNQSYASRHNGSFEHRRGATITSAADEGGRSRSSVRGVSTEKVIMSGGRNAISASREKLLEAVRKLSN